MLINPEDLMFVYQNIIIFDLSLAINSELCKTKPLKCFTVLAATNGIRTLGLNVRHAQNLLLEKMEK